MAKSRNVILIIMVAVIYFTWQNCILLMLTAAMVPYTFVHTLNNHRKLGQVTQILI